MGVFGLLTLTASADPPSILSQPSSAVVGLGQPAGLSVAVEGTPPLAYQWVKDGVILAGQTNSSLSFGSFQFTNGGNYSVVVTNANGLALSLPASLSVSNAPWRGWGGNPYSQLGKGAIPLVVATNVVTAAVGAAHSLWVTADGTLWAIGLNSSGQLGNGTTLNTNQPIAVASNVLAVAAGSAHSLFLAADGTLWGMGANAYGQLGNGTKTDSHVAIPVATNVVAAAAGA